MGLLEIALTFLILLLSVFLAITGIQVFFILRDLKKALDKLNGVDVEKPVETVGAKVAKVLGKIVKPKPKRFYKKVL